MWVELPQAMCFQDSKQLHRCEEETTVQCLTARTLSLCTAAGTGRERRGRPG